MSVQGDCPAIGALDCGECLRVLVASSAVAAGQYRRRQVAGADVRRHLLRLPPPSLRAQARRERELPAPALHAGRPGGRRHGELSGRASAADPRAGKQDGQGPAGADKASQQQAQDRPPGTPGQKRAARTSEGAAGDSPRASGPSSAKSEPAETPPETRGRSAGRPQARAVRGVGGSAYFGLLGGASRPRRRRGAPRPLPARRRLSAVASASACASCSSVRATVMSSPRARRSASSALRATVTDDRDLDLRMQRDRHLVHADGLDRRVERDLVAVDLEALLDHQRGDDRAAMTEP